MRKIISFFIITLGLVLSVCAQDKSESLCKLPAAVEQLKEKATEVTDINMDPNMLRLAVGAMNRDKASEEEVKKLVSSIKGICVRSYNFDKPVEYSDKDMDALRAQFNDSSWSNMVKVRNQKTGENVDVFSQTVNGAFAGFAIIAAEPQEFTFVRINGEIDLSQLAMLGKNFGIPKLNMPGQPKPAPKK